MFVQDYQDRLAKADFDEFIKISEDLASGNLQYAFPYHLKTLIIQYAQQVLQHQQALRLQEGTSSK